MKFLAIIPYAPTVLRTRSRNLLLTLASNGHKIVLATLWENPDERVSLRSIEKEYGIEVIAAGLPRNLRLKNVARGIFSKYPIQAYYSWSSELIRELENRFTDDEPDVVHVEHLRGALYVKWALAYFEQRQPVIWDAVDCISLLFEKSIQINTTDRLPNIVRQLELPKTRNLESELPLEVAATLVTSQQDKNAIINLEKNSHSHNIYVLPNGVKQTDFQHKQNLSAKPAVIFSGKMSYHANEASAIWLIHEIMPRIWKIRQDVILMIVGAGPGKKLIKLAGKYQGKIQLTGYVADLFPYFQQSSVAVAPLLYGTGIQNKVLEAMAYGVPVVATSTAIQALNKSVTDCLLVSDDPQVFSEHVITIIENEALWKRLSENGRRFVEDKHSWEQVSQEYERIILRIKDMAN